MLNFNRPGLRYSGALALSLLLAACSQPESESNEAEIAAPTDSVETADTGPGFGAAAALLQNRAVSEGERLLQQCSTLNAEITDFLAEPNDASRSQAQAAWHDCYQQWHSLRPYQQLPFSLTEQQDFRRIQSLINVRPFQPGYIDGLPDYPYSGLVHESGLDLTLENLLEQHQMMDAESPSLGFPVIEAFLWREPLTESWLPVADSDPAVVERRHRYLRLATDHLMSQLQAAVDRWRSETGFTLLTETGQRRFTWQSLQRLVQVELLSESFADGTLEEPEWHHLSAEAGQGRRHLLARLDGLLPLLQDDSGEASPLASWLDRAGTDIDSATLIQHLSEARTAVAALPENYPLGEVSTEGWDSARQAVAQLAVDFNTLSRQLGLQLLTE